MPQHSNYHQLYDSMLEAFDALALNFFVLEISYDKQGNPEDVIYREVNKATEMLIGRSKRALIGKSRKELFGNVNDQFPIKFDRVLKSGSPIHFQTYGAALNKYYDVYAWKLEQNQVAVLLTDITESKKTEKALKDSEEKYRVIVETTNEGIWVASPDGKTTFVNQRMAEMLGYQKEDLLGHTGLDFIDSQQEEQIHKNRKALKNKKNVQFECKFIRKNGETLWTLANTVPIIDGNGKHIANIAMHSDITERKRAEEALKRQAQLIDLSPDAIMVRQINGEITFWSKGAENLYGFSRKEAVGQISHKLLRTKFPAPLYLIEQEVLTKGRWKGELTHRTKKRYRSYSSKPLVNRKRRPNPKCFRIKRGHH